MKFFNNYNNFEFVIKNEVDLAKIEEDIVNFKKEVVEMGEIKEDIKLIEETANLNNDNTYYMFEENKNYNLISKTNLTTNNEYIVQMKESKRFFKIKVNIKIDLINV